LSTHSCREISSSTRERGTLARCTARRRDSSASAIHSASGGVGIEPDLRLLVLSICVRPKSRQGMMGLVISLVAMLLGAVLEAFETPFMQRAAFEVLLLAPAAGLLGAQIVLHRL